MSEQTDSNAPAPGADAESVQPPKKKGGWFDYLLFAVGIVCLLVFGYQLVRYYRAKSTVPTGEVMSGLEEQDRIPVTSGAARDFNVVIITMDTTRADHLACYGNGGVKTPHIDGMARRGVLFANAFTASPSTLPGHSTILTGLYPYHHGARANGSYHLPADQTTLAEILKQQGYATAGTVSAYVLDGRFGLDQGFDRYDDDLTKGVQYGDHTFRERPAEYTNESVFSWLDEHADSKFFTWIHYFDPHAPYLPPEPYKSQYAQRPYDGEIAYTDEQIGKVLAKLDELGVRDRTLVVLAGDHGEGLGDHGESTHSLLVYDATLHTPLVFHCPSLFDDGHVVRNPVSNASIVPTVLDALGVESGLEFDGVSLLKPAQDWPQGIYAETISTLITHGWAPLFTLRRADLKYIQAPHRELYDLVEDPKELVNLFDSRPEDVVELANELNQHIGTDSFGAEALAQAEVMDPEVAGKLRALGYVGDNVDPQSIDVSAASKMDPKEMIQHFEKVHEGNNLISAGKVQEGVEVLEEALEHVPNDVWATRCLASAYQRMGRADEALELFYRAGEKDQKDATIDVAIARACMSKGDLAEADERLKEAERKDPKFAGTYAAYGALALARNQFDEAERMFRKAVEMDPGTIGPSALIELGKMFQMLMQTDQAREAFEQAIEIDSLNGPARAGLGSILAEDGEFEEAAREYAIAIRYDPNNAFVLANLAALHDKKREYDQAKSLAERALEINEKCTPALNNLALIMKHTGDMDKAMELFNKALEYEPRQVAARYNLALCYQARKEEDKAVELLTEVLRYNPRVPGALLNLGVYHANHGRRDQGMRLMAQALRVDPDYAVAHAHYGTMLLSVGKQPEALYHLKRSLELEPDQQGHEELEYQVRLLEEQLGTTSQPAGAVSPEPDES